MLMYLPDLCLKSKLGIETRVLKNWGPGKPEHFAKPETRVICQFGQSGFRVCVFAPRALRLMEYYTILDNSKHVFD